MQASIARNTLNYITLEKAADGDTGWPNLLLRNQSVDAGYLSGTLQRTPHSFNVLRSSSVENGDLTRGHISGCYAHGSAVPILFIKFRCSIYPVSYTHLRAHETRHDL